jgi:HD-like signal output (HDOD) protein
MPATTISNVLYDRAVEAIGKLPPFSPVMTKLLATLAKDDVMVGQLADWIEKDTVLTGSVMRMVNSAAFGRSGKVSSVRHGIAILGTTRLRNIVLSLSVCSMMNKVHLPAGWSTKQFNLHAVAAANLADLVVQYLNVEFAEGAFVAGLLHDTGKLLLAISCPEEYAAVISAAKAESASLYQVEIREFGFSHAELSEAVLIAWKLPARIQTAARFHHNPEADSHAPGMLSLSRSVQIADTIVNAVAIPAVPSNQPKQDPIPLFDAFGLGNKADRILQSFQQEMDAIATLI